MNLTLPDGRELCYAVYGDEGGFPVIYCHGFPSSRLEGMLFEKAAVEAGVWLIVPDRPGYGESDFQDNRRFSHWPFDVKQVVEHLDIKRYSLLGVSGGAPYAASCAVSPDPRLHRLGLVCGLGPLDRPEASRDMALPPRLLVAMSRKFPPRAEILYSIIFGPVMHCFPGLVVWLLNSAAPDCDKAIMKDEVLHEMYIETFREAFNRGGRGPAHDLYLYTHAWDFDPADVKVPTFLWHGEEDGTVPVEMGRYYARIIPACKASFVPGEGHFSLPVKRMKEVFKILSAED